MTSRWRAHAAPIIARVLSETRGQPPKVIRAALREAYPFGIRQHHPYRIWCDEIRVQTGKRRIDAQVRMAQGRPAGTPCVDQRELFANGNDS